MFGLTGNSPAAQALFEHAESWLGEDPRTWVQGANAPRLRENRNAQLLCVLQALAAAAMLRADIPERCCVAGYSIGELAAWSVAGILSPNETLSLAVARADAMDSACQTPQGMVAIKGLSETQIAAVVGDLDAEIAIVNPHASYVIGGSRAAIDEVATRAQQRGATRVTPLPVHVASHTKLLKHASGAFGDRLRAAQLSPLRSIDTRLLSGVDGSQVMDVSTGLGKLSRQISHRLEWAACLESCMESGTTVFLELGPGRALSEMARAAYPDVQARSLEDFQTLDGIRAWLHACLE
jgi:[acyl-carrier-protein] S-malonyltransferase